MWPLTVLGYVNLGLLASAITTQWFAWSRGWHPSLGTPAWYLGSVPLYSPLAIWTWGWRWGWQSPETFQGASLLFGVVVSVGLLAVSARPTRQVAHWATATDLRKAGLFARHGVVLGKWRGRLLRYDGEVHTLMVAPSGSGKTTSLCIPTALSIRHSLFVHDPKGELSALTAGWRGTFSRVAVLNPTSATTDCFNPLSAIRVGTEQEIRDTLLLTDMLVDPDGERATSGAAQHFRALANQLLVGMVLHGLYTGQATTLAQLGQFFASEQGMQAVLTEMGSTTHTPEGVHPAVQWAVSIMHDMADRERSSVRTTTARALQMTIDPLVARMTNSNTFTLADLRERLRPMTLYFTVPYADQERLRPLSRLIVRQVLDYTTHRLTGWRHRLTLLLDEVQALRYFPAIPGALQFVRGYGVNLVLITPSLNALTAEYGPHHGFLEGCHLRVVFAPNDAEVAEKVSRMTGMVDQVPTTRRPVSKEQRLFSATALTYLSQDKGVVLVGNGGAPARIRKAYYYRSWVFNARSRVRRGTHG